MFINNHPGLNNSNADLLERFFYVVSISTMTLNLTWSILDEYETHCISFLGLCD